MVAMATTDLSSTMTDEDADGGGEEYVDDGGEDGGVDVEDGVDASVG